MKSTEVSRFEFEVKHTLDWSSIDPNTKATLQHLMDEVAALAEKMQSRK